MSAPTITEEPVEVTQDQSGGQRFSHYVDKEAITDASVFGNPLQALCGFLFIPGRDPKKLPICPVCKEEMQLLREFLG